MVNDPSVGDWIKDSLDEWIWGETLKLDSIIPHGFESYISIRNAEDDSGHGKISPQVMSDLIEVLNKFTQPSTPCYIGFWEGYGIWDTPGYFVLGGDHEDARRLSEAHFVTLPDGSESSPKLELPNRNYILMRGILSESLKLGSGTWDWFIPQSPNLLWPPDRSWCVAAEIDFNVSLIGGSASLIEHIESCGLFTTERFSPNQTINEIYAFDPIENQ